MNNYSDEEIKSILSLNILDKCPRHFPDLFAVNANFMIIMRCPMKDIAQPRITNRLTYTESIAIIGVRG
jgi:hypothetical protein